MVPRGRGAGGGTGMAGSLWQEGPPLAHAPQAAAAHSPAHLLTHSPSDFM